MMTMRIMNLVNKSSSPDRKDLFDQKETDLLHALHGESSFGERSFRGERACRDLHEEAGIVW
jgi:hypothetical protein